MRSEIVRGVSDCMSVVRPTLTVSAQKLQLDHLELAFIFELADCHMGRTLRSTQTSPTFVFYVVPISQVFRPQALQTLLATRR